MIHAAILRRSFARTICLTFLATTTVHAAAGYRHFVIGNPENVVTPASGLLVLQGGGTDVDENYVRMAELGGGGDFVVLRASGGDDYNDYIYKLCDCDSVETIVFDNRDAASDPFVIETIRNAEALFIAGGDQSRYVRFWKDTPVENAINFVAAKPAPVGGTSAGMAIMGEFSYSAMSDASLTAENALRNPFHDDLTLARDFLELPPLGNVITDQHLQERDRIGRTVALLARLVHDGWTAEGRAIAADREASLHIDPVTGNARVFATADHETPYVYFMRTAGPPETCVPGKPLTFVDVEVYRIGPGGKFAIGTWTGRGGIAYTLIAERGVLTSSRGDIY
ncbi:MAG: cyanophycinase [Woeseiaceae bacterium]